MMKIWKNKKQITFIVIDMMEEEQLKFGWALAGIVLKNYALFLEIFGESCYFCVVSLQVVINLSSNIILFMFFERLRTIIQQTEA